MAVYIRTQIVNPVLSLTASVTLRDAPVKKKHANAETSSIFSNASTVRTEGTDGEEEGFIDEDDLAGMQEIDLLGGLGGQDIWVWMALTNRRRKDAFFEAGHECSRGSFTAFSTCRLICA